MGDRWIEDFEQGRKQTDDSRFLDEVWLDRDESAKKGKDWNSAVPPRSLVSRDRLQGLFARYPMLYAIPALAIGTLAFLLVVGLMVR
ncbi:MAG: hypothetical protein MUP44_10050 [Anaerolineales bacterium]|nr:hypothetical protein [Anaerolineales bacterium]